MATGYTHDVLEGKLSLRQFILRVAHGMGPLIRLRDYDMDCPIPDSIEPDSWHVNGVKEAKQKLADLKKLTKAEQKAYGAARIAETIKGCKEALESKKLHAVHIGSMLKRVKAWDPPTADHEPLKKYMLEQLQSTWDFDCTGDYWEKELERLSKADPMEYYQGALESAASDIEYHAKELKDELKNCEFATKWIQALKKSVDSLPND